MKKKKNKVDTLRG